jgi:hypothetical protein
VAAGEAAADQVRSAVARSLSLLRAASETQIVSVDAVELVGFDDSVSATRQPVDRYGRTFWQSPSLEQLVAEQGVTPVQDIDELVGEFWPDDEDPDEFITWLREQRRQG